MIYILAGITGMCLLLCIAGGIVEIWDRLDPSERNNTIKIHSRKDNAA